MSYEHIGSEPSASKPSRGTPSPKVIGGVVLAVLALVFVFQNTDKGKVHFLFFSVTTQAWIWLLGVFVAGVVVGLLIPRMRGRRSS
jgi:uncharacterized integral membrane protein